MKILISAAETSSDAHGAQLLRALREELAKRTGESVEAFGIGGPHLQAEGLRSVVDASELLAMGFQEILGRLPKIFRSLRLLTDEAARERPQLAVVIDYPDFHFRLASRLKRLGIPIVYYIPPKVWVWRKGRIHVLRERFARVLSILPFEEDFYRAEGVPVKYVGNPLVDELPLDLKKSDARRDLGLPEEAPVLVIMPGSRPSELKLHTSLMLDGAFLTAQELRREGVLSGTGKLHVLLPLPKTASLERTQAEVAQWWVRQSPARELLELRISQGNAHACMVAADVGMIKSGTSTLEAGLLGCPHSVIYKTGRLSNWIFRLFIRYAGPVGLVNLVAGGLGQRKEDFLFREILLDEATPEALALETVSFWKDPEKLARVQKRLAELRVRVLGKEQAGSPPLSPSLRAARELMDFAAGQGSAPAETAESSHDSSSPLFKGIGFGVASGLWSSASALARFLASKRWLSSTKLESRVISVGNIQVGGAGKTPLVAQLAREAGDRGMSVAILCRGYRGAWEQGGGVISPEVKSADAKVCGDEAALLHELAPQAWIGVGSDRVRSFEEIKKKLGRAPELVLLDDGFQHWRIVKDLEIVAVTSRKRTETFFRDRPGALGCADLVVWTKGERTPDFHGRPWVRVRFDLPRALPGSRTLLLVTGVGDSAAVKESVLRAGFVVARQLSFPDHADFDPGEAQEILKQAKKEGLQLAMTGKDWAKWRAFGIPRAEVLIFEPEVVFVEGREVWERILWG